MKWIAWIAAMAMTTTATAGEIRMKYLDANARQVIGNLGHDCTEYGRDGRWLPLASTFEMDAAWLGYYPIAQTLNSRWIQIRARFKGQDGKWDEIDVSRISRSGESIPKMDREATRYKCLGYPYDATVPFK